MKLYLAGPMTGYEEFNYPLFRSVAAWLRDPNGYEVLCPEEIDSLHPVNDCEDGKFTHGAESSVTNCPTCTPRDWKWYMRHALQMVLEAEAIALLPGWSKSKGARREFDIALDLGYPVFAVTIYQHSEGTRYSLDEMHV